MRRSPAQQAGGVCGCSGGRDGVLLAALRGTKPPVKVNMPMPTRARNT